MRLRNPTFVDPITTFANTNKAAIQAWLSAPAQVIKREITFDEIRAAFPALAAQLTDGTIAEICQVLGIQVINS